MVGRTKREKKKGKKERKEGDLHPPFWLKLLSGVSTIICCYYKYAGFSGKILFMTMPCNTLWLVFCFLSFGGVSDRFVGFFFFFFFFFFPSLPFLISFFFFFLLPSFLSPPLSSVSLTPQFK